MDYYHYSGDPRTALLTRSIERHPDYRVLRRLPRHDELWLSPIANGGAETTTAIVDVETTALDPGRDAMIELAVVLIRIDGADDLLDLTPPVATRSSVAGAATLLATHLIDGARWAICSTQRHDDEGRKDTRAAEPLT